jgi:hypothetical protein
LTADALVVSVSIVYVFEASVIKLSGNRIVLYPPKECQEKLRKYHGKRVKVIVAIESKQ